MSAPSAAYPWQQAYLDAVCETDDSLMTDRIYEAIAAIEQRRLNPVEIGTEEQLELANAEAGIQNLIAERTGKTV